MHWVVSIVVVYSTVYSDADQSNLELGGHWFRQLLWFCSVSSHYIDQCCWILLQYIMTTLRSLISLTTQLFVQHLVQVYNKENTKAPNKCPCLRRIHLSLVIAGFPLLSTSNTHIVYMTWCHYAKWSTHGHGSVNWVVTGSRNVLDPVMCQVITLTDAVSCVWNKIQYNDITNISSWKKLQGRLQSISAILTQPHWVDISFILNSLWPRNNIWNIGFLRLM